MARKLWIGGNWKCNGTKESVNVLIDMLNKCTFDSNAMGVYVCPTSIHLGQVLSGVGKNITVCSQNVSKTGNGAYTGEISVDMLKDLGIEWTLVGHSERRQYYGETDEVVADKTKVALDGGLHVAVCIGELLAERKSGQTDDVLKRQVEAFIPKVSDWSRVVIAYEPVWAIGTGVVATVEEAQSAHEVIRKLLKEKVNEKVAKETRIVYGGSVSDTNCNELIALPDVDGFLVGGASLKPAFEKIIEAANSVKK